MFSDIKIIIHQGKQYIPNLKAAELPDMFRGRPVITEAKVDTDKLVEVCPTYAISAGPVRIDLGKCLFCGECARVFAEKIKFTNDHKISSNYREGLIVKEDYNLP